MVAQNQASAKVSMSLPDSISMKAVKNQDMYYGFELVTVSDAFTTVELKKISREIQKEKRRLRAQNRDQQKAILLN